MIIVTVAIRVVVGVVSTDCSSSHYNLIIVSCLVRIATCTRTHTISTTPLTPNIIVNLSAAIYRVCIAVIGIYISLIIQIFIWLSTVITGIVALISMMMPYIPTMLEINNPSTPY